MANADNEQIDNVVQTVHLTNDGNIGGTNEESGPVLVKALENLGFALVVCDDVLPLSLVEQSLSRCAALLDRTPNGKIVLGVPKQGPRLTKKALSNDCKDSLMLQSKHVQNDPVLKACWDALQQVKTRVLRQLDDHLKLRPGLVESNRDETTDAMRLLSYPALINKYLAGSLKDGNRCYAHVDYGTITLLIMDRPGLEVQTRDDGRWIPIPYDPNMPAVAVNVGRELAVEITQGRLVAAFHRVPGPCSQGSTLSNEVLSAQRHSIALFVQREQYNSSAGKGTRQAPKRQLRTQPT